MSDSPRPFIDYKYRLIYYGSTIVVKGIYDIKSYDDNVIMLKCAQDIISVNGKNLEIKSMDVNEIHIKGKVLEIVFS